MRFTRHRVVVSGVDRLSAVSGSRVELWSSGEQNSLTLEFVVGVFMD
jgi:hypothetical protein